MQHISIDLLMTTYNRHECVKRLLDSLLQQDIKNFRLIAGLQEPDNDMLQLVESYKQHFPIKIQIINRCSLSQARNTLLPHISGDIIALTDDDCWYPTDFTTSLTQFFSQNPVAACVGVHSVVKEKTTIQNQRLSRFSIFFNAPSWLLFFRRKAFLETGNFDVQLGIGADTPWQSGEETDFVLRLMKKGGNIMRTSSIRVMHPEASPTSPEKWYGYGRGRMYVLRKHNFPLWFCLLNVLYPLCKIPCASRSFWPCYLAMFKARLKGLLISH